MASEKTTITLADDVYERVRHQAEAEGKTVDELAADALQGHLARRALERFKRDAEVRRGGKMDEEIEALVEKAIKESRNENRVR